MVAIAALFIVMENSNSRWALCIQVAKVLELQQQSFQ